MTDGKCEKTENLFPTLNNRLRDAGERVERLNHRLEGALCKLLHNPIVESAPKPTSEGDTVCIDVFTESMKENIRYLDNNNDNLESLIIELEKVV